eukprot:Skav222592  [mRNA]  locus=scaffold2868:55988:56973:- [translate_table: standard]
MEGSVSFFDAFAQNFLKAGCFPRLLVQRSIALLHRLEQLLEFAFQLIHEVQGLFHVWIHDIAHVKDLYDHKHAGQKVGCSASKVGLPFGVEN